MSKLINLDEHKASRICKAAGETQAAVEIFWTKFQTASGKTNRIAIAKNNETNDLELLILKDYTGDGEEENLIYPEAITLCSDNDDFVYNKIINK
jgi:hypothetical protein